ncbi:uncharacterized protein LOC122074383 [Macadamia integrifolia]|uniref:uncharacterized protein LOC122074383 n=1 Tax=Macadamia integrifolia TaxID=60698 RepID=UPI001C4EBF38|nr:uncharacterized protein LOC122074383 [Macadamia integrifolia]
MDREPEELQFLGLFGIYKESLKIIFSWPKIFTKITLSLILPLTFILLAHIQLCDLLFSKIIKNQLLLDPISSEWISLLLFEASYLVFLIIFSLLCTSTVVYSIASIYTTKEVTFKKAITVFPKVRKSLMATFLWGLSFIVLHNFKGTQAMNKSKALIEGKERVAYAISLKLIVADILIQYGFDMMVVYGEKLGLGSRIVRFLLLMLLILFGLVVQSVFYFVCKSYHNERIDKSLLADHF